MSVRLQYGEDQALLRDEARRWLSERASIEALRERLADPRGDDPATWKELGELGWLGLTTPERYGGAGLRCIDLATVAEEAGRTLLPTPWLGHLLASTALLAGGSEAQREAWLPRLASGELQAAWAHVEKTGGWRADETGATWRDGRLRGEKHCVWGAQTADLFCVPVRADGDVRVAIVPAGARGVTVEAEETLDRSRRQGRVRLDDVPIDAGSLLERDAAEIEAVLLPRAWTALAAESAGGAASALDMTAAYAATRKQFDRAIGSFQAIKHPLVNVLVQVEQTRSLVYAAASAIDQSAEDAERLARMAKASASDAYVFAASRAIQFHGGYGFTEECDAHLYLRRAFASRAAFGDAAHHRARIADGLVDY